MKGQKNNQTSGEATERGTSMVCNAHSGLALYYDHFGAFKVVRMHNLASLSIMTTLEVPKWSYYRRPGQIMQPDHFGSSKVVMIENVTGLCVPEVVIMESEARLWIPDICGSSKVVRTVKGAIKVRRGQPEAQSKEQRGRGAITGAKRLREPEGQ